LPLLERVKEGEPQVRALVLAPTRELALQVTDALRFYAKKLPVQITTLYGGAPYEPQFRALKRGATVVVGTPGRTLDHMDRGSLDLSGAQYVVLDEADEMLRMGFIEDVGKILGACPADCQKALFSATMPPPIRKVAKAHLNQPKEIHVESARLSVDHIQQRALSVPQKYKMEALTRILAAEVKTGAALVFARTRGGCGDAADALVKRGIPADALHGDLSQAARERVTARFRSGSLRVLVATDVAARGIDIEHITHVINFDLPEDPEIYVHRIGRTGRAGRAGMAISFVTPRQRRHIQMIEKALGFRMDGMKVPSDADIEAERRNELKKRLLEKVETTQHSTALASVVAMLGDDMDPQELLRGAIGLLADAEGFHFTQNPSEKPPHWGGGQRGDAPAPRDGPRQELKNPVELFFPVGRTHGVEPRDLVGAIANEADIPGHQIGRIQIHAFQSFVAIAGDRVEGFLRDHATLQVRGIDTQVTRARGPSGGGQRDRGRERGGMPAGKSDGAHPPRGPRHNKGKLSSWSKDKVPREAAPKDAAPKEAAPKATEAPAAKAPQKAPVKTPKVKPSKTNDVVGDKIRAAISSKSADSSAPRAKAAGKAPAKSKEGGKSRDKDKDKDKDKGSGKGKGADKAKSKGPGKGKNKEGGKSKGKEGGKSKPKGKGGDKPLSKTKEKRKEKHKHVKKDGEGKTRKRKERPGAKKSASQDGNSPPKRR
jgi:ATP-dependent RNA helicase DeaD